MIEIIVLVKIEMVLMTMLMKYLQDMGASSPKWYEASWLFIQ